MADQYDYIETILPDEIFFITSQELEDRYPDLTPKEREYTITKEKGAVFIMQIGGVLASGERQDGRSPDYDDWSLNGDLIVYYPVLDIALELSSMGIRVNADALRAQLKGMRMPVPREASFQKSILNGTLRRQSAAVSDSPVSVCFSCAKRTSERYSARYGRWRHER